MTQHSWTKHLDHVGKRLFVVTQRRSGTHLTIDLLRKQFKEFSSWKRRGEGTNRLYLTLEHLNCLDLTGVATGRQPLTIEQSLKILKRSTRPIIKTHALPGFEQWTGDLQKYVQYLTSDADYLYIYRDGRSVLASLHVYMQYFHAQSRCPFGQFIRQELNGVNHVRAWAEHIRQWLAHPGVYAIKFEDVVSNTRDVLQKLGAHLNVEPLYVEPLLPRRLRNIWESRWLRLTSRRPEPSTILSDGHNRRKKVDWRCEFTHEDRVFFHEQAGDVLLQLGYETSDAWVDQDTAADSNHSTP